MNSSVYEQFGNERFAYVGYLKRSEIMKNHEDRSIALEVRCLNKAICREQMRSSTLEYVGTVTGQHGFILWYLFEQGEKPVYQRDIEHQFSISRSAVTATLQRMEENGLIERRGVPQDARLKQICLTAKAAALKEQIDAEVRTFEERLTGGLTSEEIEITRRTLRRMQVNLEEREGAENGQKIDEKYTGI